MPDREKVIEQLESMRDYHRSVGNNITADIANDAVELLKEQEKKRITVHKKHGITWRRNDEFSMRNLYEAICETLLDEGELFIARMDNHDRVDFVFCVAEGGEAK